MDFSFSSFSTFDDMLVYFFILMNVERVFAHDFLKKEWLECVEADMESLPSKYLKS